MTAAATLSLANGNLLDYFLADGGDDLLIYHHGTPAAGPLQNSMVNAARDQGFRLVELVRPGYGNSTRQPGRRVADVAPLVAALADHLGAERFATLGWSGGGPHALATAALLPDRCVATVSLASVAPYGEPDLDFLAGMGEDNIAEFGAALAGETDLETFLSEAVTGLREVTGDQVVQALRSLLPAVDQAFLAGAEADHMAAELRWSVANGIWGWFDDDIAFCQPWGYHVGDIRNPAQIWQGADDLMVPFAHGEWLAARVPGATVQLRPDHGHLSLAEVALSEGMAQLRVDFDAASPDRDIRFHA